MASGAVTVGGLVINLSAETGQLRSDMAQNVRTMDTSARAITGSMNGITESSGRVTDAGSRLVRQLRDEIATFGQTGQQLQQYRNELNSLGGGLRSHEDAVRSTTQATESQRGATSMLADAVKVLAAAYAALKIGEYVKDATMLAARYETLGVVMVNVGKNAGYSAEAMNGFAGGLQAQGISMVQSRESLTALAQAHVDLTKSMKLARLAQDAAVIGGINSSEAFQRMTVGLQQGDVEILRNLGLNVNFQAAYALTAATLHKHVDLLTETEKTQARVNALLAVGSDIAGTYEQAMNTAGKQLSSMSRYVEDLKVKVGSVFLEAFTKQIEAQTLAFKALGVAMDDSLKGGPLAAFAVATGEAAANVVSGVVTITSALVQHKEVVQDVIAIYAIYKGAVLAMPFLEAAAAAASYVKVLVTQGTVTWGATGAALAQAEANAVETTSALARALSSNAVAVANAEEAATTLAATTSVQGQFIATEALTAAQATLAVTTQAVVLTQGEATVAAGALTAAEAAASAGTWALTAAMGALEAVLAVILSPFALIVAALGAAAIAYNHFRTEASKKVENNLPSFDETREQLAKLNDEQKYGTGLLGDNAKQIEAVTARIKELNLAKEAKAAAMGAPNSQYSQQLKAEVNGVSAQIKKLMEQLGLLEQIREKLGGKPTKVDIGSDEQLKALTTKYTLPPARRADVLATVQPAIDSAKKLAENRKYAGDEEAQAKAKAAALAGIDQQAKNVLLGIDYAFASEINTKNKTAEVAAQNAATRLAAINAKSLSDAKALYDMRLITQEEYVNKENALNQKEAAAALSVANDKIAAAKATVGGDPVANAQALSTAIAERDALIQKNAQQAAEGRQAAAQAAIESYTREFGSIASLSDAQDELNRNSRLAYQEAGKTAEQQAIFSAQYLARRAAELDADMADRQAKGTATKEYITNTSAMISALNGVSAARMKAISPEVSAQFINDAKGIRDQTDALYDDMRNTIVGTDEARVRSAAQTAIRLAAIRLSDAQDAINNSNDSDADKYAKHFKLMGDFQKYVDAVTANADAQVTQASAGFRALGDAMSDAFDPNRIESFGNAMTNAFGNAGGAVGGLIDAFSIYTKQQSDNEAARKIANERYKNDAVTLAAAQSAITDKQGKEQLSYYGNVADAAKGFFKQNSAGYKVMQGISQAYHAAELVLELKTMATKLFATTTVTTARTTAAVEENVATLSTVGPTLAAEGAKSTAYGVSALAASLAAPFPANLAAFATVAAMLAAIGVALSGGGGSSMSVSQQRQEAQGAGSVLGDKDAKSDSIAKSIELSAANSSTQINYLSGMLAALQSIQSNIGSFASQLLRTTDVSSPNVGTLNTNNGFGKSVVAGGLTAIGSMAASGFAAFTSMAAIAGPLGMAAAFLVTKIPVLNNLIGKIGTAVFGGKQSVTDSGITISKTDLASILANGVKGQTYADIKTSGGLFRSDKDGTKTTDLDAAANQQFTSIIKSMATSITEAGKLLNLNGADFTAKLSTFVVDIGKVSLKDLKGDDLQKALESVFSKLGDQMAQFGVAGLEQFQQVGEGYLETLVRVASDYAKVDASLASIGKTFGAVGLSSIAAREDLIDLAGGIDDFQSKTSDFAQNFLTKAQQLAPVQKYVADSLTALGLGWIQTREQYAQIAGGLDLTTESGRQTYAALMNLASAFAATHAALEDTTKSAQDIADERSNLQGKLDDLLLTSAQLHERERAAVDASNLALYDRIAALQTEKDAASTLLGNVDSTFSVLQKVVEREKKAVKTSVDTHTAAVSKLQSLSQSLRSTLNSIKSPDQQVLARAAAQSQIRAVLASVKAGGALPDADSLKDALSAVSKDSTDRFATYQDYLKDLYQTQNDIAQLGDVTDDQLSVEQKALKAAQDQLDSLDEQLAKAQEQVDILKGINTNGLTLIDAMAALTSAVLAANSNPIVSATSAINGAYQSALHRAPDAAGLEWWQNAAANGAPVSQIVDGIKGSTEASLNTLYRDVLGRAPDAEGLAFWMKAYGNTMDAAEQADWLKAAQKDPGYKIPGFAGGGDFGGGWRIVGENGPELEATGPARIFNASQTSSLMNRLSNPSANADVLAAAVDRLTAASARQEATIARLEAALNQTQRHAKRSADTLERVTRGGDKMVTTTE